MIFYRKMKWKQLRYPALILIKAKNWLNKIMDKMIITIKKKI